MINLGVVEDINDPLQANRVKVRVFFMHTQDKALIPTTDLFWSIVGMPSTGASSNGIGQSHGLIVGSHVYGTFLDNAQQNFFVMGTFYSNDPKDTSEEMKNGYPQNKCTVTEKKHTFQLNDGKNEVILSHGGGGELHFFEDDNVGLKSLNNFVLSVKKDSVDDIGGNKNVNVTEKSFYNSGNDTLISSGTKIILAAPQVIMNPTFGFVRAEFTDSEKLPYIKESVYNSDILSDHPDAPTNSEVLDKGYAASICVLDKTKNMYDFLNSQLDLDWVERPTPGRNPNIKALFDEIGFDGGAYSDSTAWCAVTLSATLKRCGYKYIKTMSALNYANYGTEVTYTKNPTDREKELISILTNAEKGDILVFSRGGAFGHVGVFSGEFDVVSGKFGCLGGNQGNRIKLSYFNIRGNTYLKLLTIRKPIPCAITAVTCDDIKDVNDSLPTAWNDYDEFQTFVRNLYFEDRSDPDDLGIAAVGHVVLNRKKHPEYPKTLAKVILQPLQFSWRNNGEVTRTALPTDKKSWERCVRIAKSVLCGNTPDPTNNSTCYYAIGSRSEASFRKLFSKEIVFQGEIGKHRFYSQID